MVDPDWERDRIHGGLSSGEGLIWAIRDEVTKTNKSGKKIVVDGVEDKRLLLDEREFFAALTVMKREGNTVAAWCVTRWDGRAASQPDQESSGAMNGAAHLAHRPHHRGRAARISIRPRWRTATPTVSLFACVRRSKFLPFGGSLEQDAIDTLAVRYQGVGQELLGRATSRPWTMTGSAELWAKVYRGLSEGKLGLLGAITGRAEAQTIRLALLYALLDGSRSRSRLVHLRAALALWKYCEDSARYIFGDALGDPLADELLQALRSSGGMSRTQIRDHFKRNQNRDKLDAALKLLKRHGLAKCEMRSKPGSRGGPKVEFWMPEIGRNSKGVRS